MPERMNPEEAARQAREMRSRARITREAPAPAPPPQPHEEPEAPAPPPPEGPLDALFRDPERAVLLALLLLLSDEGGHQELVFALMYLLI